MPTQVRIDRLRQTGYESSREGIRVIREAVVSGLDTTAPYAVLTNSLFAAGIPQVGELHPTVKGCPVIGHRIQFESDTVTRVQVIYETPRIRAGGTKTDKFFLRISSSMQTVQSQMTPTNDRGGTSAVYTVYTNPNDAGGKQWTNAANFTVQRPFLVTTLSGTFTSLPSAALSDGFGKVNDAPWQGLAKGYQLFHSYEVDSADGGDTFGVTVQLITKVIEDWSAYVVAINELGKPVVVPDKDLTAIRATPYNFGPPSVGNGITRIYPYPTVSFPKVFGIPNKPGRPGVVG